MPTLNSDNFQKLASGNNRKLFRRFAFFFNHSTLNAFCLEIRWHFFRMAFRKCIAAMNAFAVRLNSYAIWIILLSAIRCRMHCLLFPLLLFSHRKKSCIRMGQMFVRMTYVVVLILKQPWNWWLCEATTAINQRNSRATCRRSVRKWMNSKKKKNNKKIEQQVKWISCWRKVKVELCVCWNGWYVYVIHRANKAANIWMERIRDGTKRACKSEQFETASMGKIFCMPSIQSQDQERCLEIENMYAQRIR